MTCLLRCSSVANTAWKHGCPPFAAVFQVDRPPRYMDQAHQPKQVTSCSLPVWGNLTMRLCLGKRDPTPKQMPRRETQPWELMSFQGTKPHLQTSANWRTWRKRGRWVLGLCTCCCHRWFTSRPLLCQIYLAKLERCTQTIKRLLEKLKEFGPRVSGVLYQRWNDRCGSNWKTCFVHNAWHLRFNTCFPVSLWIKVNWQQKAPGQWERLGGAGAPGFELVTGHFLAPVGCYPWGKHTCSNSIYFGWLKPTRTSRSNQ